MQRKEYEESSNNEDIPVGATLTDLEIFQAVCDQNQKLKVDDSDGDKCAEKPSNERRNEASP
ncbi:hypothetical protein AVEN_18830-1, partial [Araneus ventricosus]